LGGKKEGKQGVKKSPLDVNVLREGIKKKEGYTKVLV